MYEVPHILLFHPLNGTVNDQNTRDVLSRQNVNYNSNDNSNSDSGQGNSDNSNSYSYSSSSSNHGNGPHTSVNYNLNGLSVPEPLTKFRPEAIRNACDQFLGNSGGDNPSP